ncbi:MAG: protein kinase [Deltaproteobacteria bacterium]|nr:protein kinase [Deltaproteobacteria bacterium]
MHASIPSPAERSCPDPNEVVALLEGQLSAARMVSLDGHVDHCGACRALVGELARELGSLRRRAGSRATTVSGPAVAASEMVWSGPWPSPWPTQPDPALALALAAELPPEPGWAIAAGTRVDGYRVMRPLGRGGMGEVYLARDVQLGRKVALKFIHPGRFSSERALERFRFEAQTTARFSHPNVVTIHAVGLHEGRPYLALEYIEGQTLSERLKGGRVSVTEALRIALAVAEVLEQAHRMQILHLDLKPSNVMLARDGRIRLLDFGLARTALYDESGDGLEAEVASFPRVRLPADRGFVEGTPPYMAPEQWRGEPVSAASDLWALGVLLYELLAGHHPYRGTPLGKLAQAVTGAERVPELPRVAGVGAEAGHLVAQCLAKQPARRLNAQELARELGALLARQGPVLDETEPPFRGLSPFDERHQRYFFGREEEVADLLERLRDQPRIAVVGPSGAGKSSLVQAGVVPRLRRLGPWTVVRLRPGPDPFLALAARLRRAASGRRDEAFVALTADEGERRSVASEEAAQVLRWIAEPRRLALDLQELAEETGTRVLLVIDQLEELCTLVPDERVRRRFVEALAVAADDYQDPVRLLVTVRDDFVYRVVEGVEAADPLGQLLLVRGPSRAAMRQMVTRPLELVGYRYDDERLPAAMVDAVVGDAASLPLLQFTVRLLWEGRDAERRLLRRETYEAIGGVGGGLARHADGVLDGLSAAQLELARQLLLRLVTPSGTRRLLGRRALLDGLAAGGDEVLDRLVAARILQSRRGGEAIADDAEVELAHESLIRSWARLSRWIDAQKEELRFLDELGQAAERWAGGGRLEADLLVAARLKEAEGRVHQGMALPERARAYLAASTVREGRRRRRRTGVAAATLLALGLVLATFAYKERQAVRQQRVAEAQRRVADEWRAAAQAQGARAALHLGDHLEARAKLRAALETHDSLLARALHWRLAGQPLVWRRRTNVGIYDLAVIPGEREVATVGLGTTAQLVDLRTQHVKVLRGHRGHVEALAAGLDGRRLYTASDEGEVLEWEVATGRLLRRLVRQAKAIVGLGLVAGGARLVTIAFDGSVRVHAAESGAELGRVASRVPHAAGLAADPTGRWVAIGGRDGRLGLWPLAGGGAPLWLKAHRRAIWNAAFSSDGRRIASSSVDGTVSVFELPSGRLARTFEAHRGAAHGVAFDASGGRLATSGSDGQVRVWRLEDGALERSLTLAGESLVSVAFVGDGRFLVAGTRGEELVVWDLTVRAEPEREGGHQSRVTALALAPHGEWFVTSARDRTLRAWDRASGRQLFSVATPEQVTALVVSPEGTIISGAQDGTIRLWSPGTGALLGTLLGQRGNLRQLRVDAEGRWLVATSIEQTAIWDLAARRLSHLLGGPNEGSWVAELVEERGVVVTATGSRQLSLWDLEEGRLLRRLDGAVDSVRYLAVGEGGRSVFTAGWDGTLRRWDLATGRTTLFGRQPGRLTGLVRLAQGEWATAGLDAEVRLWDPRGRVRLVRRHGGLSASAMAVSRDGRTLLTGHEDGAVRGWEVATGRPLWQAPILWTAQGALLTHAGWRDVPGRTGPRDRRLLERVGRGAEMADEEETEGGLCVMRHDGGLARFARGGGLELERAGLGARAVVSVRGGCVTLGDEGAVLHPVVGASRVLVPKARWASSAGGELLVMGERRLFAFASDGRARWSLAVGPGVTAAVRVDDELYLGYADGSVEGVGLDGAARPGTRAFQDPSPTPVTRLVRGPRGILIAGYAGGSLALWTRADGALLRRVALRGRVQHLAVRDGWLVAATQAGDHVALTLHPLVMPYCQVLEEVWRRSPVTWHEGRVAVQPPPARHACARRSLQRRREPNP